METVQCNGEDTTPIEQSFLSWDDTIYWVSKDFHTLDCGYCPIGIIINMLMEEEFPIKDESQIFPQVFGGEYKTSNGWEIEWKRIGEAMQSVEMEDFSFGVFYNKAKLI